MRDMKKHRAWHDKELRTISARIRTDDAAKLRAIAQAHGQSIYSLLTSAAHRAIIDPVGFMKFLNIP